MRIAKLSADSYVRFSMRGILIFSLCIISSANAEEECSGRSYAAIMKETLERPLWSAESAYNAGHYLMVPLHAAFKLRVNDLEKAFGAHYKRMLSSKSDVVGQDSLSALERLQYLYTASRYLVLAQEGAAPGLRKFLLEELNRYWKMKPAWQWGRKPFGGGFSERLEWKLKTLDVEYSYYRAIIDEEIFLFGIAADLAQHYRQLDLKAPSLLVDILSVAQKVFKQESVFVEGDKWLLQPGVWEDHPDYAYVGHIEPERWLGKAPIIGIAMDISHSHRLPLILLSLQGAELPGSERFSYYLKLRQGLAKQFFEVVLVPPSSEFLFYRTSNFIDGRNGVFRYQYGKMAEGKGYGAHALSGTLLLGWWTFLPDDKTRGLYQNLLENFPVMLRWITENDPYGVESWMYQTGYSEVLPFLPCFAREISGRF